MPHLFINFSRSESCVKNYIIMCNCISEIFGRINETLRHHGICIISGTNPKLF